MAKGGRLWTLSEDQRLFELHDTGKNLQEIADALGRSCGATGQRRRFWGLRHIPKPRFNTRVCVCGVPLQRYQRRCAECYPPPPPPPPCQRCGVALPKRFRKWCPGCREEHTLDYHHAYYLKVTKLKRQQAREVRDGGR